MSKASVERASSGREIATIPNGAGGAMLRGMDIRGFRSGHVLIPTTWVAADLTFTSSDTVDEGAAMRGGNPTPDLSQSNAVTYYAVRRDAASAPLLRVTNIPTSGGGWMPLPAALFQGHAFIKALSTNTGSEAAVNQTADRILIFRFSS